MILKVRNSSKVAIILALGMWTLMSNRTGVPQAVTKAPIETSGKSCDNCHVQGTDYKTAVDFSVINLDSSAVTTYEAGKKYLVKLKVSGQNNPKSYGFQMVCLNSANNADAGNWGTLGAKVKSVNLLSRKYLEQSSQADNGLFYAQWTAPANVNEVKFYYAGLAANMNGNTNGDMVTTSSTAITISGTSSTQEPTVLGLSAFPNPTTQFVTINANNNVGIRIMDQMGRTIIKGQTNQIIDVSMLSKGRYIVALTDNTSIAPVSTSFVKQ